MPPARISPVTDPSAEAAEVLAAVRVADGSVLNIFATLAHHPKLFKRWLVFANHVMNKNSLPARDRELLILRVGVRCASRYEFGQHAVIARRSDISAEEIARVKAAGDGAGWSDIDRALIRAVDELHDDSRLSDATWTTLAAHYTTEQMLDLVFTVGQYHLVSFALNSCGVELDAGVADAL